jgi:hypothetical protein
MWPESAVFGDVLEREKQLPKQANWTVGKLTARAMISLRSNFLIKRHSIKRHNVDTTVE